MVVSRGGREGRYPRLADEDLISLAGSGDARAFAVLYDRHSRAAYRLAHRMTGGREAAEDLAQDAFLKVWTSADSYRSERGSVRTWVLAIVQNAGVDALRAGATRRKTREFAERSAHRSQPCEAFAETWRGALRVELRRALDALPPEQLEVLTLAYLSGRSHEDISAHLGIPLGTVKGRVRLGLKKLRDHFADGQAVSPAA